MVRSKSLSALVALGASLAGNGLRGSGSETALSFVTLSVLLGWLGS